MSKNGEVIAREKRLYDGIRSLDTGEGIYVVTGSPLPSGEMKADFFYSNTIPKLEITTLGKKREVEVSISSIADENKELLHFLFGKTRTI